MSFLWPNLLWSLLLIPLLAVLYAVIQGKRRVNAARYASLRLVSSAMRKSPGLRQHLPYLFFLLALAILLTALARPQAVLRLPRVESTIILVFDVSGSMAADDLQPNRMEAAKEAAREFVGKQPTAVKVGVVAFSDGALSVQPPTGDREAILASIDRLKPERGTSLGNGILAALESISKTAAQAGEATPIAEPAQTPVPQQRHQSAMILLLTDGENNEDPDPLEAAQLAAKAGVRIHTIGIGTAEGATLHINGFIIHSQLNAPMLQQVAEVTGGSYYSARNEEDLVKIYSEIMPELVIKPEETEITSIFAAAGIILLIIGGMLSLLWFGRAP